MLKDKKGVSLLELVFVIAIIGIMASLFVLSYRKSEKDYIVEQAAQKFAADIRSTQTKSLAGEKAGSDSPKGWGIRIKTTSPASYSFMYYYLQDLDGNKCPSAGESPKEYGSPIILDSNISFDNSVGDEIFFAIPFAQGCINKNSLTPNITFKFKLNGALKESVFVTKYGQVEI
ncbi:MAG: prepilin-type N-terminal cleavage/methylation domain-containing protein [Candidatus Portnoybacteria bacterium]|nr:prepilin-type N-terminal cleavage/methylation domain-containing protein [Candidatus Portnoybacteria bacterium]